MCSRTNIASPSIPCGSRLAWLLPSTGQFRTARSPACLQRMDDGAIIAKSAPQPTRIVTPSASISMPPPWQWRARTSGLALRCAVLRSWPEIAIVSHRQRQSACLPAQGDTCWAAARVAGQSRKRPRLVQRLLDYLGLVVLGEPATASFSVITSSRRAATDAYKNRGQQSFGRHQAGRPTI